MPLDEADLATVRSEIGVAEPPTDEQLHAIYDEVGTVAGTALRIVGERLAAMEATPRVSSAGESVDFSSNMAALLKKQTRLRGEVVVELAAQRGQVDQLALPQPFDVEPAPAPRGARSTWPEGWAR